MVTTADHGCDAGPGSPWRYLQLPGPVSTETRHQPPPRKLRKSSYKQVALNYGYRASQPGVPGGCCASRLAPRRSTWFPGASLSGAGSDNRCPILGISARGSAASRPRRVWVRSSRQGSVRRWFPAVVTGFLCSVGPALRVRTRGEARLRVLTPSLVGVTYSNAVPYQGSACRWERYGYRPCLFSQARHASATSRQPASMVREWPRSANSTRSVTA